MSTPKQLRWPLILIIASIVICGSIGLLIWQLTVKQGQTEGVVIPHDQAKLIKLYYAVPEQKEYINREIKILKDQSIQDSVRVIIEKMIRQPMVRKKYSWWPETLVVRSAYIRDNNLLILDFEKQVQYNHNMGAYEELLLVRSLVKTMVENFNDISKINFLIGGQETETLAGHIDITRPLGIDDLY